MKLISNWTAEERQKLRDQVPKTGLRTPFRNGTVQDIAKEVVNLAKVNIVHPQVLPTRASPFPEKELARKRAFFRRKRAFFLRKLGPFLTQACNATVTSSWL
jgi:hypothetical protein